MKEEEIQTLIDYRMEQAKTALDDARFLLVGNIGRQSKSPEYNQPGLLRYVLCYLGLAAENRQDAIQAYRGDQLV